VADPAGRHIYVDYAHTPDALENVLSALRPLTVGRLICVFGCGGDRDRGKRPQMGEIAGRLSDFAVVTSDNPRSEPPQSIIEMILPGLRRSASPDRWTVLVDRAEAIVFAIAAARPGDTVLIAGKGHETYQILADRTVDFDDRQAVHRALGIRQAAAGGA
jgi:UDP-N-acetylmuramoyl-L-alanyl-D-glutamate--2,6-diaminopimelate ligase